MTSNRLMSSTAMSPVTTDVDFAFAPMQSPYLGFFDAGNMPMPSLERPLLGLGHQQHNNHYDDFDCAASFPFQDSSFLLPPTTSLPPAPPLLTMDMAMAPTSPSSMHQMTLPCVPAAELYHPAFGVGSSPFLKREDGPVVDAGGGKIGLNLSRRTYFSTADVLAVDRLLLTRSRLGGGGGVGAGLGLGLGMAGVLGLGLSAPHHHQQPPRCQAEGCKADLTAAKHYHRRHKVCEYHAKAAAVAAGGKQQRFCQQCSRFHVLAEFDESKRSCRKRLTEHNRRRRKPASEQGDKEDSSRPPKRADTTSYSSDHKSASPAAAKSTAISPNGSGVSCLDMDNNGQMMISSAAAAAPTALSLSALPLGKDGDLDTMLMMRQVHGRRDDEGDEEQQRFVTSLVLQAQQHHHNGGVGNVLSTLSCSPVPDQHQNGDCNGFFEVDFI